MVLCLWWSGACSSSNSGPDVTTVPSHESLPRDSARARWQRQKVLGIARAVQGVQPSTAAAEWPVDASGLPDVARLSDPLANRQFLVISGQPALRRAPVGMLVTRHGENWWPACSLVLARPDTVLTAGHCIDFLVPQRDAIVFFPYEGLRHLTADGVWLPCDDDGSDCAADIALLELDKPYRLMPQARLSTATIPLIGLPATALGFGASSPLLSDRGLMHQGRPAVGECLCNERNESTGRQICFQVNYGLDAPSLWQFSNFGGDSGGALFAGDGSSFELIGLSTGFDTGCAEHLIEGRYVDIRNYPGLEMLDDIFCDADCSEPDSPSHEVLLAVELAYVADAGEDRHPIRIGDGATELLVNLNHETAGFRPEPATNLSIMLPAALEGECSRYYGVESCHVSNPPPGAYSIGIQRESGNPAYQLTVVAIYEE
jgi:hypothetical protein